MGDLKAGIYFASPFWLPCQSSADLLCAYSDGPACIDDLPADVLAGILALLPLSKSKVALQGVSHLWKTVLQTQSAHSIETKVQDQCLPSSPHLPLAEGGISKVARGLLDALVYCATAAEDSLEWLPLSLKALKISGNQTLVACPLLPNLRKLAIETDCGFSPMCDLSSVFPNVESVSATTDAQMDRATGDYIYDEGEMINQIMDKIEDLEHLKQVKISSGTIPDFYGPAGCRVKAHKLLSTEDDSYNIPEGMALHLQHFEMSLCDITFSHGLDLDGFANCSFLESICIEPTGVRDLFCIWKLNGFKHLPALCQSVEVKLGHHMDFVALPTVDLEDTIGWRITVKSTQNVLFTRILE